MNPIVSGVLAGNSELDLTNAEWRKSTRSGPNTDMCVEGVRDDEFNF